MDPSASGAAGADAIAAELFGLLGTGRSTATISSRVPGFDFAAAYRIAADVRARRVARGERAVGRKIGFTNRTIWAEYDVWAPIWGSVYDRTVRPLPARGETFSLAGLSEPRIEPEIVFGLATAPRADMDAAALFECIDWVAHGFELVQSVFPGWKFTAADTAAAYGLHGALFIGPRANLAGARDTWRRSLETFEIDLLLDGVVQDHGRAANVLDGPVHALRHLVQVLASYPDQPPLAAGEVVTTGTLTRALPIAAGQTWSTRLTGVALDGIEIRFA